MNNKIKGVAAIMGGVTVLVIAVIFVYGDQIRQTASLNPQLSSAKFFGGYSKNVQAPKITQYGNSSYGSNTENTGPGQKKGLAQVLRPVV